MPRSCKKLSEETVHENPWWKYKHDTYQLPNNEVGNYYYGENGGSVLIVPMLDDGRIILINQNRFLRDKISTEFVCGGITGNETPQMAAVRELLEETGYEAEEYTKVGVFDALNGLFKDTCHIFLAAGLQQIKKQKLDNTEDIEVIYRRPDEFEDMIKRGEIWDGQSLATWAICRDLIIWPKK